MRISYCIGLLFLFGCATIYNPVTQKNEYYFISEESEVSIGKNMAQDILKNNKIFNGEKSLSYLEKVGSKIVDVSDRSYLKYHFYIIDEEELSAFALPGGYIFVNKGVIKQATEDELAFILGHEIGHICARHSVKRLQASLGINLLLGIALRDPDFQVLRSAANIVYDVVSAGYSRSDELLADSLSLRYIIKSGYRPQAAFSFFEKLKKTDKGGYQLIFLKSHPSVEARIENLEKILKTTGILSKK